MFPRISFWMVLIAGALLLAAMLVNRLSGNEVNPLFVGLGAVFVLGGAVMLFIRRK